MGRIDKIKAKLSTYPKDFSYSEAKALLEHLGFKEYTKGKTSGSRVKYFRESDGVVFLLHKPHPGNDLQEYCIKDLICCLREIGEL